MVSVMWQHTTAAQKVVGHCAGPVRHGARTLDVGVRGEEALLVVLSLVGLALLQEVAHEVGLGGGGQRGGGECSTQAEQLQGRSEIRSGANWEGLKHTHLATVLSFVAASHAAHSLAAANHALLRDGLHLGTVFRITLVDTQDVYHNTLGRRQYIPR